MLARDVLKNHVPSGAIFSRRSGIIRAVHLPYDDAFKDGLCC